MPIISIRGNEMPASPIRKLAPLADAAKQRGIHVYHLNIGQPDLPTPRAALDAIRNIDRTVLEYSPSQGYRSYREKLVGYYKKYDINLSADDIIITTGGSEAVLFAFLSCLNPGDEIIVPEPAYANYMAFAISAGAVIRTVTTTIEEGFSLPKVEKFEELINERTKAILICNPNNPDGRLIRRAELLALIEANRQTVFIIDQAYVAFTTERLLEPSDVCNHPNLILIQSISKAHNIPGLRIGYLIASPDKVEQINRYIIPWSVNAIAVEAGKYILTHPEQYILPIREWQRETASLIDRLNELGDLEALPTSVTFFLVRLKKGTAAGLKQYLWDRHGLLIRDASNFRSLDETYIRISAQTAAENQVLVDAVREWLSISP